MQGHLADARALQRVLAALPAGFAEPPGGACADAAGRVRWALARLAGTDALAAAAQRAHMRAGLAQIGDAGLRAGCTQVLQGLPTA